MSNFATKKMAKPHAYCFTDERLRPIKELIDNGKTDLAINALNNIIGESANAGDLPFYLLGNAYRKRGDWQHAIDSYLEAICRNPESPAVPAHAMLMDILNFHNKDMYNQ